MKVQVIMDITIDDEFETKEDELAAIHAILEEDWGLGSVSVSVLEVTEAP